MKDRTMFSIPLLCIVINKLFIEILQILCDKCRILIFEALFWENLLTKYEYPTFGTQIGFWDETNA